MENEYEFYYPGIYDEKDTKSLKEFQAKLDLINKYLLIGDMPKTRNMVV